jgi:F0F1-type ATP synthase delta subunit
LLTFATRADIGGGMIIQAGSHVYDYSFRQQILSHKSRIAEIFNSVR